VSQRKVGTGYTVGMGGKNWGAKPRIKGALTRKGEGRRRCSKSKGKRTAPLPHTGHLCFWSNGPCGKGTKKKKKPFRGIKRRPQLEKKFNGGQREERSNRTRVMPTREKKEGGRMGCISGGEDREGWASKGKAVSKRR